MEVKEKGKEKRKWEKITKMGGEIPMEMLH